MQTIDEEGAKDECGECDSVGKCNQIRFYGQTRMFRLEDKIAPVHLNVKCALDPESATSKRTFEERATAQCGKSEPSVQERDSTMLQVKRAIAQCHTTSSAPGSIQALNAPAIKIE